MKNKNSTTCQPLLCVSTGWLRGLIPLLIWMMWLIPASVTAQNQAPNCSNFSPAIDSNGEVHVSAGDFLTNVNKVAFPVEVTVKNSWNGPLTTFTFQDIDDVQSWDVCKYLGQKLGFSAKNGVQQCNLGWIDLNGTPGAVLTSALTDDSGETYISANKMVVYCGMEPDPEDPRYRPTAAAPCDGYVSAISAQPDWVDLPADRTCGANDTARVIRRTWEAFDRTGRLTTMVDTIVVMRLPKLTAASFIGKMADTIACSLQQVPADGAAPFQYSAWKQEVGVHSYELPNAQLGALIYELPASVVEIGCNLAADCGKSAEYLEQVILIKADGTEVTIGDILDGSYWSDESSHLTSEQLAYPSVQEISQSENQATACGQTYPPYLLLRVGDQVLSENGGFVEVTADWFYNGHSRPAFWFSGAWPVGCGDQDCVSFCDVSSAPEEKGCFQIVVPVLDAAAGFLTDTCDVICLPVGQNCGLFIDDGNVTEVNDCPSYSGGHTTVTQTCWAANGGGACDTAADPDDESTWADVVSDWKEYDNNNVDAVNKQTFDLYRKTYHVDDIPPIFDFCYSQTGCGLEEAGTPEDFVLAGEQHPCAWQWEADNPMIYTTGSHDCAADIFVPDVKVIDNCSGIYQVKARVETDGGVRMVSLELTDEEEIRTEDGSICTVYTYSHLENAIRLPFRGCEGESVEVKYEAADNCWNVSEWSKFVKVLDGTPPVIVTDDEVNVTLSNEITLVEAATFDEGSWDNCSVSLLAARRTDWTAAQIDICSNISSDLDGVADILALLGVNLAQANAAVSGNPVGNPAIDVRVWAGVLSGAFANYYLGEILDLWFDSGLSGAKLVHGWLYELTHYIGVNCSGVQAGELADLNRVFDFLFDEPGYGAQMAQLGGGWTGNVPFVCEDACEQVSVELIGMDQCSNWKTGKSLAYIEAIDNAAVSEPLADLEISCEAYNIFYYQLAEEAAGYASSADDSTGTFAVLDSLFGTYSMSFENGAASRFVYDNVTCLETGDDPVTAFDTVSVVGQNGVISSACGGSFTQDVTLQLDSCGQGRIVRHFYVSGGCGDGNSRTTEIKQVISVKSACPMQESMFDTPVQVGTKNEPLCLPQPLSNSYFPDTLGKLVLKEYLEGALCNSIAIGYDVKEFDVEGYPDVKLYKVTWTAVDWCCANESPDRELTFIQKVLATIDPDCEVDGDNSEGSSLIKGDIATESGKAIGEVTMKAVLGSGSPMAMMTGDDGSYRFSVNNGWQVSLIPEKNTNFSEGVTTMDLIAVQRHLLNKKPLESKYQRIAADVNKNGKIDVFDITELRRIILNPRGEFTENSSWRFFDKNTDREVYEVTGLRDDLTVDWVGVKIGDVNGSALDGDLASSGRSAADALHLNVADRILRAGETYRVEVTSDNFADITGWQYTLSYLNDRVAVESVEPGALPLTADHWHRYAPGLVTMSWHDAGAQSISRDAVLFTIVLKANSSVSLREALSLNGRVTPAEAYDAADRLKDVHLRFGEREEGFALYQNSPNPFDGQTTIGFRLPEASVATLSVYDVTGRLLKLVEGEFDEGYNEVRLRAGDLNAVGVLYYQLDTKTYTATKKMVVME